MIVFNIILGIIGGYFGLAVLCLILDKIHFYLQDRAHIKAVKAREERRAEAAKKGWAWNSPG